MRSEWEVMTLSNLSIKTAYGYTASATNLQISNEPKFLRITDIQGGIVNWETVPYCKITDDKIANYKLHYGDIVVARTGNSTGENYMFDSAKTSVFASYLIRYIINQDIADPKFIWYQMRSQIWVGFINNVKGGSAQAGANAQTMGRFECIIPPLQTQKKIAHILSTLDDKIKLNRKMNETLEAMAQVMFKSWFVDFDPVHAKAKAKSETELEVTAKELGISKEILNLFPSKFQESEMGMIPEGWEAKTIKDFGRVITGKTPPKKIEDAYTDKGKPFITPTDVDDSLFVTKTARKLSSSGQIAVKNSEIIAGSICVTCIGSQMGKTTIAPVNSFTNQQINSIVLKEEYLKNYLLCNLRGRRKEIFLLGRGGGSTMPLLNKTSFEKVNVLLPNKNLLIIFDDIVKDNIALVLQNDIESNSLSNTRDTLLPKLLSGEVQV